MSTPSWTAPTALTAVPTLIQWLQCSLLFVSPDLVNPRTMAYIRASLLPLCIYSIWKCYSHPQYSYFTPARDFIHLNIVLQVGKYLGVVKAIEYSLCDSREYAWMGYSWAYEHSDNSRSTPREDGDTVASAAKELAPGHSAGGQQHGQSILQSLYLGWCCMFSLRGIGWSWGIKGRQIPARHRRDKLIPSLLYRLLWCHIITVSLYAYLQKSREISPDPSAILRFAFGIEKMHSYPKLSSCITLLGRLLHVLAFGLAICTSIEVDFVYVTISAYLLIAILRTVIPPSASGITSYIRPDPFRVEAWPKPSLKPILSTSIIELWGNRWHSLFRRAFVAVGARPAIRLAGTMGMRSKTMRIACGALGAFIISGFIHESINDASPWLPRDVGYTTFKFFIFQVLAFVAEALFFSLTGMKVRGMFGRIWAWSFMLTTGLLITECWIERGLVDGTPPLSQWEWWRWVVPNALVIPNFSKPRIYQVYEHLRAKYV